MSRGHESDAPMPPLDDVRAVIAHELALAPALLTALFAGVHERNARAACDAIRNLHAFGERLACDELVAWCAGEAQQYAATDLRSLETMLPALVRLWEHTQEALVERGFRPTREADPPVAVEP